MTHVKAFTGEFGLKIRYHVPGVAFICGLHGGNVHIEHEVGEEALFPFATTRALVARPHDDTRRARPPRYRHEHRFLPEPHVKQGTPESDVVVCPRQRNYGSAKNLKLWSETTYELGAAGISTVAAGAEDSSAKCWVDSAWHYERELDASIEMMRNTKLVIATDAGLAHLAVLCGVDLLLISHRGLVAPGPVVDASGKVMKKAYWPIKFNEYYRAANWRNARIRIIDAWDNPEAVAKTADRMLTGATT